MEPMHLRIYAQWPSPNIGYIPLGISTARMKTVMVDTYTIVPYVKNDPWDRESVSRGWRHFRQLFPLTPSAFL